MSTSGGHLGAGERIGPYVVIRRLGDGGMGVVLEAWDHALSRGVALKVIAPHLAQNPSFRARFTREARALAALDSAHVVRVYAHGEDAGRLYIATQLVPDGDLERMLAQRGPFETVDALDLIAQVAAGLADAHAAGLVHRDLKPANVLLRWVEERLHAYLTDFGISREVGDGRTRTAGTVGTPAYLAPELHTGGVAGTASDIYSLGCLLWAALTGRPPYAEGSDYQVATAHLGEPVPQLEGGGALVTEVNRILRTAMAKDPAARYTSAAHLGDDLRSARTLAGVLDTDGGRRPPALVLVGGLVAALVAGGLGYAATRGADPPPAAGPGASASPTVTPAPSVDRLATATASLARALREQRVMTSAQARCTAERWIEAAGLGAMRVAGFFDADGAYVDQDRAAMTPRIERAAIAASRACAPLD